MVLIDSAIGCPLGWYIMSNWLQNYSYHVEVGPGMLVLAMAFCISIALFTVFYHAIRVAIANPSKAMLFRVVLEFQRNILMTVIMGAVCIRCRFMHK